MKNNIFKITAVKITGTLCALMLFTACESYLDKTPDSLAFTENEVFASYEKSQEYVDQLLIPGFYIPNPWQQESYDLAILNSLPQGMWGTRDRWTDDCMYNTANTWNWQKYLRVGNFYGTTNATSGWWSENHYKRFANIWKGIRVCNMSITKIDQLTNATTEQKSKILGIAYFMRAHFYFELLQGWGGMPKVETVLDPESDLDLPRESYQVTAQRVAQDFLKASEHLPLVTAPEEWPRPSKMAAVAYRAKALTWAASPYANPTDDKQLWQEAAIAAGKAIELAESSNYYKLVSLSNWRSLFAGVTKEAFSEVLFGHFENARKWVKGHEDFMYCGIRSAAFGAGGGAESPTENFAQCFTWSNGEPIDANSIEYKTKPFTGNGTHTGRDPRFNLTMVYNEQVNPMTSREGRTVQIWNESYSSAAAQELLLTAQKEPSAGYTTTGYYNWKLFAEAHFVANASSNLMYNYIRLADLYLYYAEAANRVWGPTGTPQGIPGFTLTAVGALNKVRERATMPAYDNSKPWLTIGSAPEFEEKIRNEFRIETAFEGKRFYDLRRWKLMTDPKVLVQKGLYIKRTGVNTYEYSVVTLKDDYQLRWQEQHYLFPINPSSTFLGPNFKQNPGW